MDQNHDDTSAFARVLLLIGSPRAFAVLVVLCAGLFVADFLYHKHPSFEVGEVPGFYAIYGLAVVAVFLVAARLLGGVLKRPEDYYAPNDVASEPYPDESRADG